MQPPVPVYPKPGLKDKETWSDIHTYIIPLVLGAMLIIGVVAILLAVWQRFDKHNYIMVTISHNYTSF